MDPLVAEAALALHEANNVVRLDTGQRNLALTFTTSPARLAVGIGPAGAGKTSAMRAFTDCWTAAGGRVVALAASSKAAKVLGAELGTRAENLHKFLHEQRSRTDGADDPWFALSDGDAVLVDEAGMAGTLQLAELMRVAERAGAVVRLLGDPAQLAAVAAGGALRLLDAEVGALRLDTLHRFSDPAEAEATLRLRAGDAGGVEFYLDNDRVRAGSRDAMLEAAYDGWAADMAAGRTSILLAATSADVTSLNARARLERVARGQVDEAGVDLRDGNTAGVGDWVVTRANVRTLTCHRGRDWVKNGDLWRVTRRHRDGSLSVRHLEHGGRVRLPDGYVGEAVELGYASTSHRAQGTTVDTAHPLVTPEMTREALYVASTRGRDRTNFYVATEDLLGVGCDTEPDPARDARQVLAGVLRRVGGEDSATATIRSTLDDATRLPALVARYDHVRTLAARDALTAAASQALPDPLRARALNDPGTDRLALALADASGRGASPAQVLRNAADLADLSNA
ncbi:MAG: ATP-dependent DNA helicase, partial [Acidimicrobiales bacterium]